MTEMRTVSAIPPIEGAPLSSWPLRSYLDLEIRPSTVPLARRYAQLLLAEWGLPALAEPVEQVVAELVANGLSASGGIEVSGPWESWTPDCPHVRLWLISDHHRVLVQVWDGSERLPERRDLDPEAESGRGLWLVEALCERWGAYRPPEDRIGKVVWGIIA